MGLEAFKDIWKVGSRGLPTNKLKVYDLKFGRSSTELTHPFLKMLRNPHLDCLDINKDGRRHLIVLAPNEEEALLMREYLIDEGIEN